MSQAHARPRRWLLASLLVVVGACGREPEGGPARVVELARGFRPVPLADLVRRWESADGGEAPGGSESGPFEWRLRHEFTRADWERRTTENGPLWRAALPRGAARHADRGRARMRVGTMELARAPTFGLQEMAGFVLTDEDVFLGSMIKAVPENAVLELALDSGAEVDGVWTASVGEFIGAGIPVWSGERESLVADVPPESRLSFTLRHTGLAAGRSATFRVWLDSVLLGTTRLEGTGNEWIALDLPAEGRPRARFEFAVEGPPGLGLFASPVLAPRVRGAYRERPWSEPRPNVVLFLADTFRADNLAAYGGDPAHAPHLNRLAEESLCFVEARACAAWTLPSITALMTGCYPPQIGVKNVAYRLPEEVVTLAEHFARAGYRTGAVTDAVYFSSTYGLHQGFGWFRARDFSSWSLDASVADAASFLDGDDGRPIFLVLHTYRTHDPYRTGREESDGAWKALKAEVLKELDPAKGASRHSLGLQKSAQALALYRDGSRMLDECFGEFRALLEERGVLARGYLAFTADHGEAFGENGTMQHGGSLWDSRLRVPLLVHGHDLAPGRVPWTVSNVDLAPTLAALAGLAPDPRWAGTALLGIERDQSVFAFRLNQEEIAVIEGGRKIFASSLAELDEGRVGRAYDLAKDRGEEHDLSGVADWAADLALRSAPRVRAFFESSLKGSTAEIDASELRTLQDLGYGGEH